MILVDVNVLLYAYDRDSPHHPESRRWLNALLASDQRFGMSDIVLWAVIRISTHPRIFKRPSSVGSAIAFVNTIRNHANCMLVVPGPRHWEIFTRLCAETNARAGLVTDAYLAAIAIESGSEWITMDADYARFNGLQWRKPFS